VPSYLWELIPEPNAAGDDFLLQAVNPAALAITNGAAAGRIGTCASALPDHL
jgi:hypothetical protein